MLLDAPSLLANLEGQHAASAGDVPGSDRTSQAEAEIAILCNSPGVRGDNRAKDNAGDTGAPMDPDDVARARVAVRRRQFMGGGE